MRVSEIFPALNDASYAFRYVTAVNHGGTSASGDEEKFPGTSADFDVRNDPADEGKNLFRQN